MQLIRFNQVSIAYGNQPLLDKVDFQITSGERVCLIGRNGAGKSTLMKTVAEMIKPDDGNIWRKEAIRIGMLNQDLPLSNEQSVYKVVASGLHNIGQLLNTWHDLSHNISNAEDMRQLEIIQEKIEQANGWKLQQQIENIIKRFGLDGDARMEALSGGAKRRVELARALVNDPELLLLDEPTNHMDIITINWMEKQLKDFSGALLFITHDRDFLRSLATRIVELDRGQLHSWDCDYDTWLTRKAHQLEVEETHQMEFDKKLAKEEAWIRQGIKARRTRNEGRVRTLEALRKEYAARRKQQGNAKFSVDAAERSGKLVTELTKVSHGFGDQQVIKNLDFCLMSGDKVGLIGANGVGKSTLLKIILGDILPQSGHVKHGTKLQVAYFDQLREQLSLEQSVIDNVAGGRERVTINGKDRHIISYLEDFLFSPQRARTPVKALSGGERNRLLLARLFSKPANLLILDEPTNDLDIETLELLETILVDFKGTLLLVSHERRFLDNVVTSSLVFEGNGLIQEYVGGFTDWLNQGGSFDTLATTGTLATPAIKRQKTSENSSDKPTENTPQQGRKKLSYKAQRELEALPGEIESLEEKIKTLETAMEQQDFYLREQPAIQTVLTELEQANSTLEKKIERWAQLEDDKS